MASVEIKNGYKITISRHRTRVTTYENLLVQASQPIKEGKKPERKPSIPSDYAEFNYYNRRKKRCQKIKELSWNNFEKGKSCMVTLTFRDVEQYTNYDKAYSEFKRFIKRMNSHFSNFLYIATFNRQTNGNWHFHVLCNLDDNTGNDVIARLWKNGFTYKTDIDTTGKFKNVVDYLIANMSESAQESHGRYGYLASRNLEHNKEIVSYHEEDSEEFDQIFPIISEKSRRILYETKIHLGVHGEGVDQETGEVFRVTLPDEEMNDVLKNAGYESWDTIFTYVSSSADFSDKFRPIEAASPKEKKFKRTKL